VVGYNHNTGSPFVPLYTQKSNTIKNEAQVWCARAVGVKQNNQNERHEDYDKCEKRQTTSHWGVQLARICVGNLLIM
jgi:hypothetical protein